MGKKSRRPNRNKPKDIPAAASTAVAAPRQEETATVIATYNQLCASLDWAGLLELESEMSAIANNMDYNAPSSAGRINFMIGSAHKLLGGEGGIEQATLYYEKTNELAKKAGDNEMLSKGGLCLAQCYVETGRVEEAMDLYKSLCEEIGKESLHHEAILVFTGALHDNHEISRALPILEEYLGAIESSWGKRDQCTAYGLIATLYRGKNDFAKSNIYFERHLSIAKETKNVESEASALYGL